jgi:glycosyltransferase involved in cell wall biosynthesis
MKIEIITRCTRPANLYTVRDSIFKNLPDEISIKWRIIFDTSVLDTIPTSIIEDFSAYSLHFWKGTPGDFAHMLINRAIDLVEEDAWFYILDDDNELHPSMLETVFKVHKENPIKQGMLFSQFIGGKDFTGLQVRQIDGTNIKVREVDMAQFLLAKKLVGDKRLNPMQYIADGYFIEELYAENALRFIIIDDILCLYNSLQKPTGKSYTLPRILVVGDEEIEELKSFNPVDYESDELNVLKTSKDELNQNIVKHNPDCILSTGEGGWAIHPELCVQPYDIRQRWIHPTADFHARGEMAYICAMSYILGPNTDDLVSIITPIYNTKERLWRTYNSIVSQTHGNWEWVITNDSTDTATLKIAEEIAKNDHRVKVYDFKEKTRGIIGESKYRGFVLSRGKYLLELDHDDVLLPHALELMLRGFREFPDAGFVYSDCAEVDEAHNSLKYNPGFCFGYGDYRSEVHQGKEYAIANTSNINPITIRHIVGVPNHFRAWERDTYFRVGCHNRRLSIADDYELLVRTFLDTKFVKIPYGCYLQFYHESNSQNPTRADIQRRVKTIANYYNERIKARFEELGKEDWAYPHGWNTPSRFGEEEGYVNYILEINPQENNS